MIVASESFSGPVNIHSRIINIPKSLWTVFRPWGCLSISQRFQTSNINKATLNILYGELYKGSQGLRIFTMGYEYFVSFINTSWPWKIFKRGYKFFIELLKKISGCVNIHSRIISISKRFWTVLRPWEYLPKGLNIL